MNGRVIYSCPFVPPEWIEAHGFEPVRVVPSTKESASGPEVCPYAHAFAEVAISDHKARAVVVTTVCDQMRRAADVIATHSGPPVFLMHVPHTWQSAGSYKYYISELHRLGGFLVGLGGEAPTKERLAAVMCVYDDRRGVLSRSERHSAAGVPIALLGGPVPAGSPSIFDMIESAGGFVALDGTETGERTRPARFDRRELSDDPLAQLAEAYFGSIPDPFRRPNSGFYEWLKREIDNRGVRAIILRRYVWCDIWHAEAQRIKEWSGLPFLELDVDAGGSDKSRAMTRIESLMEMLK